MTPNSWIRTGLAIAAALTGGGALASAQTAPDGELIRVPTFLIPPDSLVRLQPVPSTSPRWTFEGYDAGKLAEFLKSLGMAADGGAEIADPRSWLQTDIGTRIFPSAAFIRSLTPEARAKIYAVLAESEQNPLHRTPFLFGADVQAWFRDSTLPPELIDDIENLSYPKGGVRAFSDLAIVLASAAPAKLDDQLMRAVYGSPSWIVSVRWPAAAEWEPWLDHWTAGGRNLDHVPFLEALGRNRAVATVDLIHLLPPNGRKRLNTWASLSAGIGGTFPDSFSSAMRFFEAGVPDAAIDSARVGVLLDHGYDQVDPPYRYGDILFLSVEGEPTPRHAEVYIAEDLVYTKLSRNVMHPWILMRIEDIRPFFEPGDGQQLLMQGWRKRVLGAAPGL